MQIPLTSIGNLSGNPNFRWEKHFDSDNNLKYQVAQFSDLKFIKYESVVIIQGSLHKFFNEIIAGNGRQNYNDYTFQNFFQTCVYLNKEFGLNPFKAKLQNVEIGVNIHPLFNINDFLDSIITCKNTLPDEVNRYQGKGHLLKFIHQRYSDKIYNKGKQFGRRERILRIECHVNKMAHFQRFGIVYLSDLLDLIKIGPLVKLITEIVDGLQISSDFYDFKNVSLTKPQLGLIEKLGSEKSVRSFLENGKKKNLNRFNLLLENLLQEKDIPNMNKNIVELIHNKWNELTYCNEKTLTELIKFLSGFTEYKQDEKVDQINLSYKGLVKSSSKKLIKKENEPFNKLGSHLYKDRKNYRIKQTILNIWSRYYQSKRKVEML